MGIFDVLFKTKKRVIKEYRFIEIAETIEAPHMAKQFKEMLDTTASFGFNPDDLFWHQFSEPLGESKASKIIFNAKFINEDESGNKVYLDTGDVGDGDIMQFFFKVSPSGDTIWLSVNVADKYSLFTVLILLEKK